MFFVLLSLFALLTHAPPTFGEDFKYTFTSTSCDDGGLICMGSATSKDGYLSLTPDPEDDPDARSKVGRVLRRYQIVAGGTTKIVNNFTFNMATFPNSNFPADGITFIIVPDTSLPPDDSQGGYLGIMNAATDGSVVNQLAVEFDTFMNDNLNDISNNHVGIITTSISKPVASKNAPITMASGNDTRVQIVFDNVGGTVSVYMGLADSSTMETVLVQDLELSEIVPQDVYMGFTASTGEEKGTHRILNWSYESSFEARIPSGLRGKWNIMYGKE